MGTTPGQAAGRVILDLGGVSASAAVRVNGERDGIRVAPPWTVPTPYRGTTISGLLSPARLEFPVPVVLKIL